MKQVSIAIAAALIGAILALSFRPPVTAQQGHSVRYQLVTGKFRLLIPTSSPSEENGVFRIDTETGATWIYQDGMSKGVPFRNWDRIPDPKWRLL